MSPTAILLLQMTDRHFKNEYPDHHGEQYLTSHQQLDATLHTHLIGSIEHHVRLLEQNLNRMDSSDGSVYTGTAGIALLYLRLASLFPDQRSQYMSKAKAMIDSALGRLDERTVTFLCGAPGALAIAAVIYTNFGDQRMVDRCVDKIVSMKKQALRHSEPDEHLYGRAGYLYTLMYLRRELGQHAVDSQHITDIFEAMIKSGERYARDTRSPSPLMYKWHDSEYMGAAHGVTGIIYMLLRVTHHESFAHLRPYVDSHLLPTIEFLKSKRLPSGNYISSSESKSDRLVQWCHGAPGFVYAFVRAYQVTGNSSYLELATAAGDVVWERGLLTKGYGICHGTAGNGYVLLNLYHATNDQKWLHRALKFVDFCSDYGKHRLSRTPDNPYSLFEGLAGTIYFMTDVLAPADARFPAFE